VSEALQARDEMSRAPEAWEEVSRAPEAWEEVSRAPEACEEVSRAPEAWEEVSRAPEAWEEVSRAPEDREEMSVGGRGRCPPGPDILNKNDSFISLTMQDSICTINHTWTELIRIPVNIQYYSHDFL
jgi:hypothetical protein